MAETLTRQTVPSDQRPDESGWGSWPLSGHDWLRIGFVAAVMYAVTVGVGLLVRFVLSSTVAGEVDRDISTWFADQRTETWNRITDWGSALSDTITIVIALLVLLPIVAFATKRWRDPLLLASAVALETLVFVSAAFTVGRDRPPVEQLDMSPPTASFPSGHTGAAVAFYVALAILVFWWTRNRLARGAAVVVGVAAPIAVALSRLYRGMHFTTDVIWGAVVGLVAVWFFARLLYDTRVHEEVGS